MRLANLPRFGVVLFVLALAACATKPTVTPTGPLDTPEHHLSTGVRLLKEGNAAAALKSFERAKALDAEYVPAYEGAARARLVMGEPASALEEATAGLNIAETDGQRLPLLALSIRAYTLGDGEEWLSNAENAYQKGLRLQGAEEHGELHLVMGQAWMQAQQLQKAAGLFTRVVALNGAEAGEADLAWKKIQAIERAAPTSEAARQIAFQEHISRADLAALISQELDLPSVLKRSTTKPSLGEVSDQGLTDYKGHVFEQDIIAVHRLGVQSLRIRNGAFEPDKSVRRVELALVVEDVLLLKEGGSRSVHVGATSPFKDLNSHHFAFNAMMTAVTRGLLEGNPSGKIDPSAPVSGAETLLVVRRLKTALLGN